MAVFPGWAPLGTALGSTVDIWDGGTGCEINADLEVSRDLPGDYYTPAVLGLPDGQPWESYYGALLPNTPPTPPDACSGAGEVAESGCGSCTDGQARPTKHQPMTPMRPSSETPKLTRYASRSPPLSTNTPRPGAAPCQREWPGGPATHPRSGQMRRAPVGARRGGRLSHTWQRMFWKLCGLRVGTTEWTVRKQPFAGGAP